MSAPDFIARALAVQERRSVRRAEILRRLQRGILRGGLRTAAMASPPTIAGTPSGTSAITGTIYGIANAGTATAAPDTTRMTFLRATWARLGGSFPSFYYLKGTAANYNGSTVNAGTAPMVRFYSDAPDLELVNKVSSGAYSVYVDGQLVSASTLGAGGTGNSNDQKFTRITWGDGSGTYRKVRLYEVEGASNMSFGGIKVPTASKIWPAPLGDDKLRGVVFGDSFTERSLGKYLPQMLGQPDTRASGVGGSGWIATNGGNAFKAIERVQADVIAAAPHFIVDLFGLNDTGQSTAAITAAGNLLYNTIQAALPDTLIFMTGPMSPNTASNTNGVAVRDGKLAVCTGRKNCFFTDNLGLNPPWVTGTGRSGSPTGDGNADWVTGGTDGSDTTHPTDLLGGQYLAQRIALDAVLGPVTGELAALGY